MGLPGGMKIIDFIQIGPPKGIEVRNSIFPPKNIDFCILANNLNFGLSEIVEGTFLKIPTFHQNVEFLNFRPDFLLWRSKSLYVELILWVSELILLGIRGPSILRTCESGNTEGPSILV